MAVVKYVSILLFFFNIAPKAIKDTTFMVHFSVKAPVLISVKMNVSSEGWRLPSQVWALSREESVGQHAPWAIKCITEMDRQTVTDDEVALLLTNSLAHSLLTHLLFKLLISYSSSK